MHELGVTMEMVDMAIERAEGRRVRRLRISVGKLAAIDPEAMRFCFDACTADTVLEGAALVLLPIPGKAKCRDCALESEIHRPYGQCSCGSDALDILSGHEVMLIDMEVI